MRKIHEIEKGRGKAVTKRPALHDLFVIDAWRIYAWGEHWVDLHVSTDSCSQVGDFISVPFCTGLCFPSSLHGACIPFIISQRHDSAEGKVRPADCATECLGSKPSSAPYKLCELGQEISLL